MPTPVSGEIYFLYNSEHEKFDDDFKFGSTVLQYVGVKFKKDMEFPLNDGTYNKAARYRFDGETFNQPDELMKDILRSLSQAFPQRLVCVAQRKEDLLCDVLFSDNFNKNTAYFVWKYIFQNAIAVFQTSMTRLDMQMMQKIDQLPG